MKSFNRLLRAWLERCVLAVIFAALLILPDYLFRLAYPTYTIDFNAAGFVVYCLFGLLLVGMGYGLAFGVSLAFLSLMQLGQFLHFAYFGSLVMPNEVHLLFMEWDEIWQSLRAFSWHAFYPVAVVLLAAGAMVGLSRARRAHLPRLLVAMPIFIGILCLLPYRAYRGDATQAFYPSPYEYALRNTLYAVSFEIGKSLPGAVPRRLAHPVFSAYRLERLSEKVPPTIVVVMGESLTHSHMSLFGYGRQTTPWLDSMRSDGDFVALPAIAGGVSTKVSLPTFFNVLREPGNIQHLVRYETNLFKLAKARGMSTHYISAQNANLATYAGVEFADELVTHENLGANHETEQDFALLPYIERIDLGQPNFVVLHQRNSHGPYEESSLRRYDAWPVKKDADRRSYAVDTYDNSIRSTDAFMQRLWSDLKKKARGPVYLFMTSDHGEMMGEGGRFGHNALTPEVMRVPFLFWAFNGDPAVVKRIRAMSRPTHYEIGQEIARLMGYDIVNPNQRDAHYFVNGIDLDNPGNCQALVKDASAMEGWRPARDPLCEPGA